MANRPDCAYFLLLGLCGAAFLLTIGGILTYVAFNPGSIDGRPHSALSHIPHFHHHTHHAPHPDSSQHHLGYPHHQNVNSHFNNLHTRSNLSHVSHESTATHSPVAGKNETSTSTSKPSPSNHSQSSPVAATTTMSTNSSLSVGVGNRTLENSHKIQNHTHTGNAHHDHDHDHDHVQPHLPTHHRETSSESSFRASYEAKAKQSLVLAIIGPLCLLMGILVTLIVGVLALKYDCDHEPEPNIAFLRLRSEMSLNCDPDKNNYELLRPMPSSSIDLAGGTFSINPTGLHEGGS